MIGALGHHHHLAGRHADYTVTPVPTGRRPVA